MISRQTPLSFQRRPQRPTPHLHEAPACYTTKYRLVQRGVHSHIEKVFFERIVAPLDIKAERDDASFHTALNAAQKYMEQSGRDRISLIVNSCQAEDAVSAAVLALRNPDKYVIGVTNREVYPDQYPNIIQRFLHRHHGQLELPSNFSLACFRNIHSVRNWAQLRHTHPQFQILQHHIIHPAIFSPTNFNQRFYIPLNSLLQIGEEMILRTTYEPYIEDLANLYTMACESYGKPEERPSFSTKVWSKVDLLQGQGVLVSNREVTGSQDTAIYEMTLNLRMFADGVFLR